VTPAPRVADVAGVPMSALVAEAPQPRAVIVALHGGAVTARYFDLPGWPQLSLLHTGPAAGFTVVALDRPGYGRSACCAARMGTAAQRAALAYAAVGRLLAGRPQGAGLFLLGHSQGCVLALQLAAGPQGAGLLGLALAGTGQAYQPAVMAARMPGGGPPAGGPRMRELVWGPPRLYPPGARAAMRYARAPGYEAADVRGWATGFPALAARVTVPVHLTVAEHEQVWQAGPTALAGMAALFTAAPRVRRHEQPGAGHMLSRGWAARAYHLTVLAFAGECLLDGGRGAASDLDPPAAGAAGTQLAGG
jgi:pimeloyl-ACP methyl ester carboxylesterase